MLRSAITLTLLLVGLGVALSPDASGQWSAGPGETVRNGFGPQKGISAPACRGACGMDCPSSCDTEVRFECAGENELLRVNTYSCGTHQACRDHDDCLDRCSQEQAEGYDCEAYCHTDVMNLYPVEQAVSWAAGGGPYDGDPILFEYTMDRPDDPEAKYRCPEGATLECADEGARCLAGRKAVDPVFDTYEGGTGSVWVTDFKSGAVCTENGQPSSVCEAAVDIQVRGEHQCAQAGGPARCTWYGFELFYHGATPGQPLICSSSGADSDFLGDAIAKGLESIETDEDTELGSLLSGIQEGLESGESLDSIFGGITVTTADGQVMGGEPKGETFPEPGVPTKVDIADSSGYLMVPMFAILDPAQAGRSEEHVIHCLQNGRPVIETTFRLHFTRH